ncbi:Organic solute transporter subunit beta [Liparis tanakae]|uniref:Organic solute transporter subunit beta n=1 Tax=Liparis tanakae TaxID=230148 RepID=A0A4Z2HKB8_9TELE|nr:Organic solute transporter subunit beta [Liparis tanakae]
MVSNYTTRAQNRSPFFSAQLQTDHRRARAFMIHNTQSSLCLEQSESGEVLLKNCNLDSESQQWIWIERGMLMCVMSSRCLSALQKEPVQTLPCRGSEVDATATLWDCDMGRLISRNSSMLLSVDGGRLVFTHDSKLSKWKSLDEGDICQEKLRSRRASDDPEEFEVAEKQTGDAAAMTEEQREYLRWYYRSEDQTIWTFVLLGLAFVCLLIGFLLLGLGAMANKNRKKIAKYKAAAALSQKGEELLVISPHRDDNSCKPTPSLDRRMAGNNGDVGELKAGDIVVTWKNGNTSAMYSDTEEEKQELDQEEEPEELPAAELEPDEAAKMME